MSFGSRIWLLFILTRIQKIPRLLVGASDGYLYMYNLDKNTQKNCTKKIFMTQIITMV